MPMNLTRRDALKRMGSGFGMLSLAQILGSQASAAGGALEPKPALSKFDGQQAPDSLKLAPGHGPLMGTPFEFRNYGQSGIEVSELFPNVARHIDECCVIR